jgi:alkylation response protein AidB-like acyl-CoA dehydrogenase
MDFTFTEDELAFRDELRAWLHDHHPGPVPVGDDEAFHFRWAFERKLAADGWNCVHWPREYGGRGATLVETAIFNEELALAEAPDAANIIGTAMAGPTIMVHGTEEQRARYLPPLLAADEFWCQGFSEPDAGSDLAALRMRGTKVDGGWLLTGQKVWTTRAQYAHQCMLVARTDPQSQRHQGLTYFLVDMASEGVKVVPIRQITGDAEFNEMYLDEVFVPDDAVLGGVGNGWQVAMTTLMNERAGMAFGLQAELKVRLANLTRIAAERGALSDAGIARTLGDLHIRTETLRLTAYRGLSAIQKYGQPGPEGSLTKWMWSDTTQRLAEVAVRIVGPEALLEGQTWSYELLKTRSASIEGGTTEILKNIVAERVLGLPRLR